MSARRGAGYEVWALAQAQAIWTAMGFAQSIGTFEREVAFRGVEGSLWRVDVVGRCDNHLFLLECKDKRITPQEIAGTLWRFADIATRYPELRVHGAIALSRRPSGDLSSVVRAAETLLSERPNMTPTRLLITGPMMVSGVSLMWELGQARAHAIAARTIGMPVRALEELEWQMRAASFLERLSVCLDIRAHPAAPVELKLAAQLESSMCHMHLGATSAALLDAQDAKAIAAGDPALTGYGPAATVLELSTLTKLQLETKSRAHRPGERSVARVARLLPQLEGRHRIGALHLIGSWHGYLGEAEPARRALREAKRIIDDSDEGLYQALVTEIRLLELAPANERPDRARELLPMVSSLTDVAQQPARVLIDRLDRGLDTSIATSFAPDDEPAH